MRGKLIEDLKFQQLALRRSTTNESLYNGSAATTTSYIDTRDFDSIVFVLGNGATVDASVACSVLESASTDPTTGTLVTGATFTANSAANANAMQSGSIQCKNTKRYLWLNSVQSASGTAIWGALAILGKGDSNPQTQDVTPTFDLD